MSLLHSPPATPNNSASIYHHPYYTRGPSGETFYFWPASFKSPNPSSPEELSPGYCSPSGEGPVGSIQYHPLDHLRPQVENSVPVKNIRRRVTANRKEKRRTISINHAFAELRGAIPQIPTDTKLSKIKTLRLATSYIAYLTDVLSDDKVGQAQPVFKAEIEKTRKTCSGEKTRDIISLEIERSRDKKSSGRTGWPQHVWALELKQENPT